MISVLFRMALSLTFLTINVNTFAFWRLSSITNNV
jgi:hypothetical protein